MEINPSLIHEMIMDIDAGNFRLPSGVLTIDGYSSAKVRELLHRIVSSGAKHYLEIGVHLGSTFIPAIYRNKAHGTAIDNWSLDGHTRGHFEVNLFKHIRNYEERVTIIEGDAFKVKPEDMPKDVDVYFYDGDHTTYEAQHDALCYYKDSLAPQFVWLVDDFNWDEPRRGTYGALRDLHYKTIKEWVLPSRNDRDDEQWWNGLYVGIIEK